MKDRVEVTTQKEVDLTANWPWVGAFFDNTGSVDLGLRVATYKEGIYFNLVPRLTWVDKDTSKLELLQTLYGGSITKDNRWSLGGDTMVWILKHSFMYMPSRKPTVDKILAWAINKETAIGMFYGERALALEKERRFDDLDESRYESLILFPGFSAGALDAGASFRTERKKGKNKTKTYIHLEYDSGNLPMLYSFQKKFGGSVEILPKGTKGSINGKEFTTKRDSGKWNLAHYDLLELLKFVGPYIILKRDVISDCLVRAGIDPSTILGYNSGIQKKGR